MSKNSIIKGISILLLTSAIFIVTFCGCAYFSHKPTNPTADGAIYFSVPGGFYTETQTITLALKNSRYEEIHYTLDGSVPTADSPVYTTPIMLTPDNSQYPKFVCIRAIAVGRNISNSEVTSQTYFVSADAFERFTTYIFCVWGDKSELTDSNTGILSDKLSGNRGSEWEREVYLTTFDAKGNILFSQDAGVRAYGGASRDLPIKSMKLYAREEYDADHKTFKTDLFETPSWDGGSKSISKYKRLVLRNCGNDFQFAYLRDEFCQTLAKQAGYQDYEAVTPAVAYLNGEYYGYYWLHENYNSYYFEEKYGKNDGTFYVLEGSEEWKYEDSYEEGSASRQICVEYNDDYHKFIETDLTTDSNYAALTRWMDVENYLDYYALNIYICNWDWPQNNYKCYRYLADKGSSYGDGVFDGRWRYLPHDMDYTFGLYGQTETQASYDNLGEILDPKSDHYSPLFTQLMQREDCRTYFITKIYELMDTVMDPTTCNKILDEVDSLRMPEQTHYMQYLLRLRNKGVWSIWSEPSYLEGNMNTIRDFISDRPTYMAEYLATHLSSK